MVGVLHDATKSHLVVDAMIAPEQGPTDPPPICISFKVGRWVVCKAYFTPEDFCARCYGSIREGDNHKREIRRMSKPWKKIRVVVEVPVLVPDGGSFTEKDLSWSVKRAIEHDGFWQDRKYLPRHMQPIFGSVQVKEFERAVTAAIRFRKGIAA